jgi:predicted Zn finger-like uncharacterized protein
MIVVCSTCQARFKVADEKIGPRGAKVRCSKCQTVFVVHKELGVMAAEPPPAEPSFAPEPAPPPPRHSAASIDLDLEGATGTRTRPSGLVADPFARAAPPAPAADPFAASSPAEAPPDPFGAQPSPAGAADPFAASSPSASPDPFASTAGGFGPVDPFVASVGSPTPGIPASAVTDLSDLLGAQVPSQAPPDPAEPPPPEPSGILDTGFDFDPSPEPGPTLADAAPAAATPQPSPPPGLDADLALDERTPAHTPLQGAMPGFGDFAGADPFADQEEPLETMPSTAPASASSASSASSDFDGFEGGFDAAPPKPPPEAAAPHAPAPAHAEPPAPEEAPDAEPPAEPPARTGFKRMSRARAVAVNVVSLVALLAVAVGILALWRGFRPGAGGLFTPAVVGTLGTAPQPFTASGLTSGLYERSAAPPVLFVRGAAVSHATAPVRALRVRVALVRRGDVVARGEGRVGAIPTPEELYGARDAAGLAAVLAQSGSRAPASVKPGDSVPFLVAFADVPPDAPGTRLDISFEPMEPPPAAPAPSPQAAPAPTPAPAPEAAPPASAPPPTGRKGAPSTKQP